MTMIREAHPEGLPLGCYDVFHYTLRRDGSLTRDPGFDRDVSDRYVERLKVGPREMAQATCRSSPGGLTLYGSAAVKAAWDRLGEAWEAEPCPVGGGGGAS